MEKQRILLVDDEKSFTNLMKLNLEDTGRYEVRFVNWAEDALDAIRDFRPNLVFLDIIMPRMAGGDVVALIENDPELCKTPIVFITAAVRKHQVKENDGIISDRPCLAKPASIEEVIHAIEVYATSD